MPPEGFLPGQRVTHAEFGFGVVVGPLPGGFARVFFGGGERDVPVGTLAHAASRAERVVAAVAGGEERLRRAWMIHEAHALPLMEGAATLTAAKIDLLPHQIVLTHRLATAGPRRFLIADEVGLGKTVEAALVLRELASRGEMRRALMVVPAGLVNNWHRELCEVFHLDFEVFGSEGDVTDRKSNAFAKHHRLIASIDTLKRPNRIKRLLDAPPWDLVVFDEAHHLTAYRSGSRVRKTENYKLAEALRDHARDLLLLSATPHQGDHFRFWMLIQLLNPTLFRDPEDMVENRHRLNAVMFRRTKADACRADGSALFARRDVHSEAFLMAPEERGFYERLRQYLEDGFALARQRGNAGRGLGFVMAIFQKIAASSFAAVRRTLRRRLLALTLHEAILRDRDLDIDGREACYTEARALIRAEHDFGDDAVGRSQVDQVLADLKLALVRGLDEDELEAVSDPYAVEYASARAEDAAALAVEMALPQERTRIQALLANLPDRRETKVEKLLAALGTLWGRNPAEKVVVFATYLGTVDLLGREIEAAHPGMGVVVLRGGDHGAKLAAERKFWRRDGPKVLVCTAAGREGINLQVARILFNFDLPWNPMDIEQRIGRIHRYGQEHTAQVYNLVLSDTIEGKIFLLLDEKLQEIARALGKVDDHGNVAEDLHAQVLGQLAERLNYERLYQDAITDPELKRTRLELEAALANATEARKVVFELFQDLEGFRLEEYRPLADVDTGMRRILHFVDAALPLLGQRLVGAGTGRYEVRTDAGDLVARFVTSRDEAKNQPDADLLGLDHPVVERALATVRAIPPEEAGVAASSPSATAGVITWWVVRTDSRGGQRVLLQPIAIDPSGDRSPGLEALAGQAWSWPAAEATGAAAERLRLLAQHVEPALRRELLHRGLIREEASFSAELVVWLEVAPGDDRAAALKSTVALNRRALKGWLSENPF